MSDKDTQEDLGDSLLGSGQSCSLSSFDDGLLTNPDNCDICDDKLIVPRVLSCLHVFCEECLEKTLMCEAGDSGSPDSVIVCPSCNQDTLVGIKKTASLPLDVMTTNISDVSTEINLTCTSCTAKEIAISRCCTCHNLLCSNCNSAHQYMRCFEHHNVATLDELRSSGTKITIHKPLLCEIHPNETVLYYCVVCNQPACNECTKSEHKAGVGHQCEGILDSDVRVRQELESLLNENKNKLKALSQTSTELESSLEDLANQRSTARGLINESYQSYKAVLEKCHENSLNELSELYHERELDILDMTERVGKDISLVKDACRFTSRLLENGTTAEIVYLRKVVGMQLMNLISKDQTTHEKRYTVAFVADFGRFEYKMKSLFGKFITESSPKETSPVSAAGSLPVVVNGHGLNGTSVTNSSPISISTSLQSSFDGDMNSGQLTNVSNMVSGYTSIAEYNLARLASLAGDKGLASMPPSPAPSITLADLLQSDTAYQNLQSLAKLGLNASENTMGNGNNMMVRGGNSPSGLSLTTPILNGFGPVSSSTSPILSTPDDIIPDPLHGMVHSISGHSNGCSQVSRQTKTNPMQIRCKFGVLGNKNTQFNSPHGFCLGLDEDIIVADTNNHRIQVFDKIGTFKFEFGEPGKEEGQLWYPRKVAVMRINGKYVVCDRGNERSRMQIFTKNGHFIKKIAIRFIDIVAGLAVTQMGDIVAVDSVSPTIFVISENGELLRWFDCSDFMCEPSDIAVHGKEFYVCDFKGHNVVVFNESGQFIRRIGKGNITNFPNGIDISDAGDVLVGDSHGNRFHVAVFTREGTLISEFECPYVKVSRCCGLKITSEGYVVTLAKNNHHVLVLDTLYIL